MIVDDAAFIREVLRHQFVSLGLEVVGEAEDGKSALQVIFEAQPDWVILDLVMPEINGIDVAEQIREKLPEVKVVACSTMDHESIMKQVREAGCHGYIRKPFQVEDLRKVFLDGGGRL